MCIIYSYIHMCVCVCVFLLVVGDSRLDELRALCLKTSKHILYAYQFPLSENASLDS